MVNIVCGQSVLFQFKKSNFFKRDLGKVSTIEKQGSRVYNDGDPFAKYYNTRYRTTIYKTGKIGDISFYLDYNLIDDIYGLYYGESFYEYVMKFDIKVSNEKGINSYIGSILKDIEEKHENESKNKESANKNEEKKGDPSKLITNPSAVKYEDIVEYIKSKQQNRYKI